MQRALDRTVREVVVGEAEVPAALARLQQQAVDGVVAVLRQRLVEERGAVRGRQFGEQVDALVEQPGGVAEVRAPGHKAGVGAKGEQVNVFVAHQQRRRRSVWRQQLVGGLQQGRWRCALDCQLDVLVIDVTLDGLLAEEEAQDEDGCSPQAAKGLLRVVHNVEPGALLPQVRQPQAAAQRQQVVDHRVGAKGKQRVVGQHAHIAQAKPEIEAAQQRQQTARHAAAAGGEHQGGQPKQQEDPRQRVVGEGQGQGDLALGQPARLQHLAPTRGDHAGEIRPPVEDAEQGRAQQHAASIQQQAAAAAVRPSQPLWGQQPHQEADKADQEPVVVTLEDQRTEHPAACQPEQPLAPAAKAAPPDVDHKGEPPGDKEDHREPLGGFVQVLFDQQHKDRRAGQDARQEGPPQQRHGEGQQRHRRQHPQLEHGIGGDAQPIRRPAQHVKIERRVEGWEVRVDDIDIAGGGGELGDVGRVQPLVAAKAVDGKGGGAQRQGHHQEEEQPQQRRQRHRLAVGGEPGSPNRKDAACEEQQQQLQPDIQPEGRELAHQRRTDGAVGGKSQQARACQQQKGKQPLGPGCAAALLYYRLAGSHIDFFHRRLALIPEP